MAIYGVREVGRGTVKIGFTRDQNSSARKKSGQTFNSAELEDVFFCHEGTDEDERRIQAALKQAGAWVKGEIFKENHEATQLVITAAKGKRGIPLAIRLLEHYLMSIESIPGEMIRHEYDGHGVRYIESAKWKQCCGCRRILPFTDAIWGKAYRLMHLDEKTGDRIFYDQPRCKKCRTANEYFEDDKTPDMFR